MRARARHAVLLLCTAPALAAAQSGGGESALARAEVNPIGKLQRVPIELTSVSGGSLDGQASNTLSFKPIVPTDIGMGMMLVIRPIVPFDNVPGPGDSTRVTGLGDINPQFYFTRAHPASVMWGFGPGFSLPTATNLSTRTGDWGLGPVAAAMWQPNKHFSIGAIATQFVDGAVGGWADEGHDLRASAGESRRRVLPIRDAPELVGEYGAEAHGLVPVSAAGASLSFFSLPASHEHREQPCERP